MKHQFHFTTLISMALPMAVCATFIVACASNSPKEQESAPKESTEASSGAAEQAADETMKAPQIQLDESGLIRLSQCPTTYDKLEVSVSEDNTVATISYDGEQIQTISDSEDGLLSTGDKAPIYFMDANFDGFVDIFIGPGESRTYSTLLIWDAETKQFKREGKLGDPSLQNFMLYPSKKYVFEGGSASWCSDFFTRSIWDEGKLKTMEELLIVSDAEQYGEYEVENKYTLKDDQQNIIFSTDDASSLPAYWRSVLDKYGSDLP